MTGERSLGQKASELVHGGWSKEEKPRLEETLGCLTILLCLLHRLRARE